MSHRALNNVGRWLPCLRHTSSCIRIVSTLVWQTLTSNFIMFCFCFLFRYHNSEFSFPVQVFGAGSSRSQKCEDRSAVVVQEIAKQIWTPKASVYLKRKVPQKFESTMVDITFIAMFGRCFFSHVWINPSCIVGWWLCPISIHYNL